MMQTAVSVARTCGMISTCDNVVVADAYPPDSQGPARINWIPVENPVENTSGDSDSQVWITLLFIYQTFSFIFLLSTDTNALFWTESLNSDGK